jgi:hypothetical protein
VLAIVPTSSDHEYFELFSDEFMGDGGRGARAFHLNRNNGFMDGTTEHC